MSLLVDEHLSASDREKVQARLEAWLTQMIADKLKPLVEIGKAEDIAGLGARLAYQPGREPGRPAPRDGG